MTASHERGRGDAKREGAHVQEGRGDAWDPKHRGSRNAPGNRKAGPSRSRPFEDPDYVSSESLRGRRGVQDVLVDDGREGLDVVARRRVELAAVDVDGRG